MKKFTPYILIILVVIVGYFVNAEILKQYKKENALQESLTISNIVTDPSEDKKIVDNLETILVYPKKNLLSEFELWDFNQQPFYRSHLKDQWSLIFSGYTNCPDICPNTLNDLTHVYQAIDDSLKNKFQFILFSVDPERDTPKRLKAYLNNFHDDFVGISGTKNQIDSVTHQLGSVYSLNKSEGEYYSVDHSGRIFIVDPKGRRYGILKSDVLHSKDKTKLVKELESLL